MGGGSGGGGRGGRSGGGGGGIDMTTEPREMPLDTTISQINIIGAELNRLETQYANFEYKGPQDHAARRELRNQMSTLQNRQNKLKDSIHRNVEGKGSDAREVLWKTTKSGGKKVKDLGPWTGTWRQHYGAV